MARVTEKLRSVQFVVDEKGEATAALVDIQTWRELMAFLEDIEDVRTFQAYWERRQQASSPEEMGLIEWVDADEERAAE